MSDPTDSVVLRTEGGPRALPLLRVVVSGVASCQNVSMEQLDDLQMAMETLVAEEPEDGGELSLEVHPGARGLSLRLGGLTSRRVKAALTAAGPDIQPGYLLYVQTLLGSLVDEFRVVEEADDRFAVQMEKWA